MEMNLYQKNGLIERLNWIFIFVKICNIFSIAVKTSSKIEIIGEKRSYYFLFFIYLFPFPATFPKNKFKKSSKVNFFLLVFVIGSIRGSSFQWK